MRATRLLGAGPFLPMTTLTLSTILLTLLFLEIWLNGTMISCVADKRAAQTNAINNLASDQIRPMTTAIDPSSLLVPLPVFLLALPLTANGNSINSALALAPRRL